MNAPPNSPVPLSVIRWAAQECEWQRSGERSVAWMTEGWLYARRHRNAPIKVRDVLALGSIVEPRKNMHGIRKVGVYVRDHNGNHPKLDHHLVPAALQQLVATQDLAPGEWFRQYEEIHPFVDGNGRTGNLLYNWLARSLLDPTMPPNLWHDPQRDVR